MRTIALVFLASAAVLSAQIAPVPSDPLELVTGETQVPSNAQQRSDLVTLVENALTNHNLHLRGNNPFDIRVSFTAAATTLYPAGQGTLEESWVSARHWRWSATLGNYSELKVGSDAAVYSQNTATMPMRLKTLREVLFAPVPGTGRRLTIRSAAVSWNGAAITCILTSAGANAQVPEHGRQWYESEYCIDPATSALRVLSVAPGMYVAYDYANGHQFHGRLLPGKITVTENGAVTLEAQITSVADADPANLAIYTPTAQMIAQGAAPVLQAAERFPMILRSPDTAGSALVQPVIIHATLDQSGKILEVEALPSNAFTARALTAVMQRSFGARSAPAGASPYLREAFINVQFRPDGNALLN